MKTRQINAPKWPAKISCRENLPDSPARIIRRIYLPEKPAISTRGLLARDPPFPAQNPQARPGPPTLPPPPSSSANGAEGEGAGSRPGPPTHLEQVLLLSFPISWMVTYSDVIRYIHILHRADWMKYNILLKEKEQLLGGGEELVSSRPVKGSVLHNCIITGGQQACHTDEDRIWKHI